MNSIKTSKVMGQNNRSASNMLNNVISDLKDKSDIDGAVIINGGGQIIARALPDVSISPFGFSGLLPKLMELSYGGRSTSKKIMFPHLISEYNGQRILARPVTDDLFLLVLLQESCYMSPAMLDTENSILRIQEILSRYIP